MSTSKFSLSEKRKAVQDMKYNTVKSITKKLGITPPTLYYWKNNLDRTAGSKRTVKRKFKSMAKKAYREINGSDFNKINKALANMIKEITQIRLYIQERKYRQEPEARIYH